MPDLDITEDIGLRFAPAYPGLVMYNGPNPPRFVHEIPRPFLRASALIDVIYSDVDFAYTNAQGSLMIPNIGGDWGPWAPSYDATIIWRKDGMYLAMGKLGNRNKEEYHIAPAPGLSYNLSLDVVMDPSQLGSSNCDVSSRRHDR